MHNMQLPAGILTHWLTSAVLDVSFRCAKVRGRRLRGYPVQGASHHHVASGGQTRRQEGCTSSSPDYTRSPGTADPATRTLTALLQSGVPLTEAGTCVCRLKGSDKHPAVCRQPGNQARAGACWAIRHIFRWGLATPSYVALHLMPPIGTHYLVNSLCIHMH